MIKAMDKVQTLKGFRDFLPGKARKRQYVIDTMKKAFESYGFEPLETPALEYEEILTGKYGDEGDKLMYRFKDNGGRSVAMRYDQTVPLARVVAQYRNDIPFPFKRYQIQPVWRAENTQKGRFREFLQSDIDTVGTDSPLSDAEILAVVTEVFKELGFKSFKIFVNDRNYLVKDLLGTRFQLPLDIALQVIRALDKIDKISTTKVIEEMVLNSRSFITEEKAKYILSELQAAAPPNTVEEIIELTEKLSGLKNIIEFKPYLARGLDYYTGIIIEVEIPSYDVGSVGGGGRYDNLIGMFAGRQIPAVGFAFGFDRIIEAMEEQNLFPKNLAGKTQILVTVFSPELTGKSLALYGRLKQNGIAAEVYPDETAKMEKQLKYADAKKVPFVAIAGPDEVSRSVVTIRNMASRKQQEVSIDSIPELLHTEKKEE